MRTKKPPLVEQTWAELMKRIDERFAQSQKKFRRLSRSS